MRCSVADSTYTRREEAASKESAETLCGTSPNFLTTLTRSIGLDTFSCIFRTTELFSCTLVHRNIPGIWSDIEITRQPVPCIQHKGEKKTHQNCYPLQPLESGFKIRASQNLFIR